MVSKEILNIIVLGNLRIMDPCYLSGNQTSTECDPENQVCSLQPSEDKSSSAYTLSVVFAGSSQLPQMANPSYYWRCAVSSFSYWGQNILGQKTQQGIILAIIRNNI